MDDGSGCPLTWSIMGHEESQGAIWISASELELALLTTLAIGYRPAPVTGPVSAVA